jgi:hypothetical protein
VGLYRFDPQADAGGDDLDLRDEIQKIALEFPYYGRPRITAELTRISHRLLAKGHPSWHN